jgi:Ca2+/Na+ antiporter
MQASATQALALVQQAEGWSVGNVLGALFLGTVIVAVIGYVLFVTLRR